MSQSHVQSSLTSMVEETVNKAQKEKLAAILKHVSKLSDLEKLYLYMKLPTGLTTPESAKRNYLAPMTSANRTTTTLTWIKSHYVEDKNICLPKQDVYNQYRLYCEATNTNPVGSADFGKMVKTAFPNIHHRRLGQRGKSKYCYGGLKRKTQMDVPSLPVPQTKPSESPAAAPNPLQEMQNLSSQLICEWACRLFDKKFVDVKSLAQYLIQTGASYGKKASLFSMMYDNCGASSRPQEIKSADLKLQDTHALLQCKLHQKEVLKGHANLVKRQEKSRRELEFLSNSSSETNISNNDSILVQQVADPRTSYPYCKHFPRPPLSLSSKQSKPAHSLHKKQETVRPRTMTNELLLASTSDNQIAASVTKDSMHSQEESSINDRLEIHSLINERDGQRVGQGYISKPSLLMSVSSDSDNGSVDRNEGLQIQGTLEVDDHKHQKRTGDLLTGSSHDRVSKRRRCMTSLGMPHQELAQVQMSDSSVGDPIVQGRIRPYSCPTLREALTLGSNVKLPGKEVPSSKRKQKGKGSRKSKDKQRLVEGDEGSQKKLSLSNKLSSKWTAEKTSSDKSSFHFVQKPTVIAVRKPGTLFPSVMSCPNFSTSLEQDSDSKNVSTSDIKKTHNILNTLLSSEPSSLSQATYPNQSPLPSRCPSTQLLNGLDNSQNQTGQKLPHTLDNAYIISSLSTRSAFVPVASNKLHDFSRSRSSHPCLNMYSPSTCSSSERQTTDTDRSPSQSESERYDNDMLVSSEDESVRGTLLHGNNINRSASLPQNPITSCSGENAPSAASENFKPISYSTFQTSKPVSAVISHSSVTPTPVVSSSPISQSQVSSQTISSTVSPNNVSKPVIKTGTKSPVTPPKRQPRSRFTPIRPKIGGCTPSPQKKDMRPVSMIIKEQRVRNAQDLLVSLASSYQGEVKLQMPAELLGLPASGKSGSSDVLVTIGGTPGGGSSRLASGLCTTPPSSEIKVAVEPQANSTSGFSAPITSFSVNSSNVNSQLSDSIINCPTVLSSQGDISSSNHNLNMPHLSTVGGRKNNLVIADQNGAIYTLDRSLPFPLPENVKNSGQSDVSIVPRCNSSSSVEMQNVISIADINGRVIGPDDTGQSYLIVPSSETSSLQVQPEKSAGIASSLIVLPSEAPLVGVEQTSLPKVSKENQKITDRLPMSLGVSSSSSALLSELSQLASASKKEKTQTLIQHDSTLSAFHKCAPNKPQTLSSDIGPGSNLCPDKTAPFTSETLVNGKCISVLIPKAHTSTNVSIDGLTGSIQLGHRESVNPPTHSVRKRKASKSRETESKDKKRQNTSEREGNCNEDDDVVIVEVEKQITKMDENQHEEALMDKEKQSENSYLNDASLNVQKTSDIDLSDTDALLQMITGSHSLTVKQTVMAMNSLRAEMKKKLQDSSSHTPSVGVDSLSRSSLPQKTVNANEIGKRTSSLSPASVLYVPRDGSKVGGSLRKDEIADKPRPAQPTISHSTKRNISLNLESLESDALLDNEPTLDHRLMGDAGEVKSRKSENKTSVAVVAKTYQSLPEVEDGRKRSPGPHSTYNISTDTLRSYQMILNGKKGVEVEGIAASRRSGKDTLESHIKKPTHPSSKAARASSRGMLSLPRRSVSCVRDILERGALSTPDSSLKQDKASSLDKTGGAEYFDALLSKLQSKADKATSSDSHTKRKLQREKDLDIPLDVVDFVTESMSSQSMYNYQSSARCVSVPNTRSDYFNFDDTLNMTSVQKIAPPDKSDNANAFSRERNVLLFDQKQVDTDSGNSDKQNVFLSPVGPAKLARRLSIEKSVTQAPVDRSMVKTPIEFTSLRHAPDPSQTKPSSGVKGQSTDRRTPVERSASYTERKRAKTPYDPVMNILPGEKKQTKPGLNSYSSDGSVSPKPPVNRALSRTPMDKYFHKIFADSLLSKYQTDSLNQQQPSRDQMSGNEDHSSSQTPSSDAGYRSVSATPVSDFGYNSISPSPVMMSSSTFFGECGRRDITSPATIFMPLRSDSALSLNNNNPEHPLFPAQANLSDILPSVSSQTSDNSSEHSDQRDLRVSDTLASSNRLRDAIQSSLSANSSQMSQLNLQIALDDTREQGNPKNCGGVSAESLDFTKLVSSFHNIPTPPFSPNSTNLMTTALSASRSPVHFSIPPFSPLPTHESSPSPPSIPRFLLPASSSSTASTNLTVSSFSYSSFNTSPPRLTCSQGNQSPSVSHVLTPSPHILARPPSSPSQYGPHPSPPFTPGSQRSMPSPCPTPSSFKSLVSPRSLTPSADSGQAHSGFMPIQSSCVLTASKTPSHTYIQPIKPVVTLASPSSSHTAGSQESQTPLRRSLPGILSASPSVENPQGGHLPNASVLATMARTCQFVQGCKFGTESPSLKAFTSNQSSTSTHDGPFSNVIGVLSTQENSSLDEALSTGIIGDRILSGLNSSTVQRRNHTSDNRLMQQSSKIASNESSLSYKNSPLILRGSSSKSWEKRSDKAQSLGLDIAQSSNSVPIGSQNCDFTSPFSPQGITGQDRLQQSSVPSHSQLVTQVSSHFTAIPSKLQVDLTKFETSQNPTCMVRQTKPFQSGQCKIDLDSCDTIPALPINSASQNCYSNLNSLSLNCPNVLPFDTGQGATSPGSGYDDIGGLNTAPTDSNSVWTTSGLSKPSCEDDLQATLEVLRDMDSQYFPTEEDNSNGATFFSAL